MQSVSQSFGLSGVDALLAEALYSGDVAGVRDAVISGANPNAPTNNKETILSLALQWLSRRPHFASLLRVLLDHGADLSSPYFPSNLACVVESDSVELLELADRVRPDWNIVMDYRNSGPVTLLDELDEDIGRIRSGRQSIKGPLRNLGDMYQMREALIKKGAVHYVTLKRG